MIQVSKGEYLLSKGINLIHCGNRKILGHERYCRSSYYGKRILNIDESNLYIKSLLSGNNPCMVTRFGDTELRILVYTIENELGLRKGFPEYIKKAASLNAGFFPATDINLLKYGRLLWNSIPYADAFGVWFNLLEDYVIHKQNAGAALLKLEGLEPYRSIEPWSEALEGKRVLVVHPFVESIQQQYAIREHLFADKRVLPSFELITLKAIQSNAGNDCGYSSWFDAFDVMKDRTSQIEFDIAIVGCGSYGLPLSVHLKELGKKVVHLAGATQILFGIKGARWDAKPEVARLYNDQWCRPCATEKPRYASEIEGGCYW